MTDYRLRDLGPRVFISYSFRDRELADRIASMLSRLGCQVRMEDEQSLINQRLPDVLPRRIADAEAFIQLRTTSANQSNWVDREFTYAVERRAKEPNLVLLPIVFDRDTLRGEVTDWVYADASLTGITDELLDLVGRTALSAVHLLPLDDSMLFQFDHPAAEDVLRRVPADGRRVIIDSDGSLPRWMDDIATSIDASTVPHRQQWLQQEERRRNRSLRALVIADEVARRLAVELHHQFESYNQDYPARAVEALQRFSRLVVGPLVLHCEQQAPPDHPLRTRYGDVLAAARDEITRRGNRGSRVDFGLIAWALGRRPSDGCDEFIEVGLDAAHDKEGCYVFFPRTALGSDWELMLRLREPPAASIQPWDWGDFALPQIAWRAALNIESPDTAQDELEFRFAWQIEEYSRMGYP